VYCLLVGSLSTALYSQGLDSVNTSQRGSPNVSKASSVYTAQESTPTMVQSLSRWAKICQETQQIPYMNNL